RSRHSRGCARWLAGCRSWSLGGSGQARMLAQPCEGLYRAGNSSRSPALRARPGRRRRRARVVMADRPAVTMLATTAPPLDAILDTAFVGIAFTRNRQFQHANPRFEELFGWRPGELVGQPGRCVWPSDA